MPLCVVFKTHNSPHQHFFSKVSDHLTKTSNVKTLFINDIGSINGKNTFEYETEICKIWDKIDISDDVLERLKKTYSNFNFMRALYSEREFNYYPYYYNGNPVSREYQLKYLVGCFEVFNIFLNTVTVDCIISEMIIGLSDAVLKEVCETRGVKFISTRQSKMTPGIIACDGYNDVPFGMYELYDKYKHEKIPKEIYDIAKSHVDELKQKIDHPSYMEVTKKKIKITQFQIVRALYRSMLDLSRKRDKTAITVKKHPRLFAYISFVYRIINIYKMKKNYKKWFIQEAQNIKYFIYPLHYEPESSTLVRSFYFSDQLSLIKLIAKLLPVNVVLYVKEHRGNVGYRKTEFYKEISYLPNVFLIPPDFDISDLIKNCIAVITLSGRMGWEAIANNKPVIALGDSFWNSFETVLNVQSWIEMKIAILDCCNKKYNTKEIYDNVIAFAASYIECIHKGNFVLNSKKFLTDQNIDDFCSFLKYYLKY